LNHVLHLKSWGELSLLLCYNFLKTSLGIVFHQPQDELEKVYISFGIGVNWVLLLCYICTSKVFPQWPEFLLNCLYICIYIESLCRMNFPDLLGNGLRSSAWIKSLYILFVLWLFSWVVQAATFVIFVGRLVGLFV
jgi:hypothetical protein